jgi:hypothetical protein
MSSLKISKKTCINRKNLIFKKSSLTYLQVQQLHWSTFVERRQFLLRLKRLERRPLDRLAGQLLLFQTTNLVKKFPENEMPKSKKSSGLDWNRDFTFKLF